MSQDKSGCHLIEISQSMTDKLTGESQWPLATHLGEGKLRFQPKLSCGIIPLWNRLQEIASRKNQE